MPPMARASVGGTGSPVPTGTHGGTAYTRPSSVPGRLDTVLVTDYTYHAAGWLDTVTDPRGLVTKTFYDHLGRTTRTVEAFTETTLATVLVNQEQGPNDFNDQGVAWEDLGTFTLSGSQLAVQLTDNANDYVIADALRVERVLPAAVQYLDDGGSGFSASAGFVARPAFLPAKKNELYSSRVSRSRLVPPRGQGRSQLLLVPLLSRCVQRWRWFARSAMAHLNSVCNAPHAACGCCTKGRAGRAVRPAIGSKRPGGASWSAWCRPRDFTTDSGSCVRQACWRPAMMRPPASGPRSPAW